MTKEGEKEEEEEKETEPCTSAEKQTTTKSTNQKR